MQIILHCNGYQTTSSLLLIIVLIIMMHLHNYFIVYCYFTVAPTDELADLKSKTPPSTFDFKIKVFIFTVVVYHHQ